MFMATKTLKTRIQLKYDTYANWTTNNPTPLAGELCVVVVPASAGAVVQEPAILFKVGDGTTPFNTLNFTSGIAADVYDWAKAETKPTYAADEITGIGDYIATYVDETLGISVDTDTQYRILKVNDYNYKLQSKAKGEADTAFADVSEIVIPKYDDTTLAGRVTAIEALVGSTAVATQIANAISALNLDETYAAKAHTHEIADVTGLSDAIADAKAAGTAAQSDVDALEAKVGTVPENKTVVQMISDAQTAATYDDAEVKAGIAANTAAIATLNGEATVEGSVKKTVSDEIAKVVAGAPESFDTLKEVSDWISTHGQDAASMNSAILALQNILDGIGDTDADESATVVAYVQAAIAALNIGDYATAANLTALAERVTTAEGKITTAEGKITTAEEKIATLEEQIVTKANDSDLAAIAKTGNVNDLVQTDGNYIIFNCGSSSEVI